MRALLSVAPSTKEPEDSKTAPADHACALPRPCPCCGARPHRPAGSTHHDAANTTQPTRPCVLPAPGRLRRCLPKCSKFAPITHAMWANETRLPACDRLKLSSCRSSSMVLAPTCTTSRAVNSYQIAIEPAAAGCSPIRDFVHRRFADAGRRCASHGRHPQTFT